MAKTRRLVANPAVRSVIRAGVRDGLSDAEIASEVSGSFHSADPTQVDSEIRAERRRQGVVDTVMAADKRKNIDLGRRLGCRGKNARARWGITIFWSDPNTGEQRQFNWTGETSVRGRLADLINDVIASAIAQAIAKGYQPTAITSASTSGRSYYRINYVECV